MAPSGAASADDEVQSLPGHASGSGGEIHHENDGVATRASEAHQMAGPTPQDSTEGMPDSKNDTAAHVSTSIAVSVLTGDNYGM